MGSAPPPLPSTGHTPGASMDCWPQRGHESEASGSMQAESVTAPAGMYGAPSASSGTGQPGAEAGSRPQRPPRTDWCPGQPFRTDRLRVLPIGCTFLAAFRVNTNRLFICFPLRAHPGARRGKDASWDRNKAPGEGSGQGVAGGRMSPPCAGAGAAGGRRGQCKGVQ